MHLIVFVCVTLFLCAESHVLMKKMFDIPSEKLTVEVVIKDSDIKSYRPSITRSTEIKEMGRRIPVPLSNAAVTDLPTISSRHGIGVPSCPFGFIKVGTICFPSN